MPAWYETVRMSRRLTLAIVGRYVLARYRCCWRKNSPAGDEIQLTDAIDMLIEKENG